jgi:hypothetical protein
VVLVTALLVVLALVVVEFLAQPPGPAVTAAVEPVAQPAAPVPQQQASPAREELTPSGVPPHP